MLWMLFVHFSMLTSKFYYDTEKYYPLEKPEKKIDK